MPGAKSMKTQMVFIFCKAVDGLFQIDPKDDEPAAAAGVKVLALCKVWFFKLFSNPFCAVSTPVDPIVCVRTLMRSKPNSSQ